MEILAGGTIEEIVYAKAGERRFARQDELARELGLLQGEMKAIVDAEAAAGRLIVLPDGTLVSDVKFDRLEADVKAMIEAYHESNTLADGIPRQELLSRLKDRWHVEDDKLVQAVLKYLLDQGVVEDRGKSIAIAGFSIEYTDEQLALKEKIAKMYGEAGIEMIKNDEVLALYRDARVVRAILEDLVDEGVIYKVNPSYHIEMKAWGKAVETARSFEGSFTIADYRDRLGTSRKYASELLPAMDKAGITVFDGESRTVVVRN
jgi:selenocysteine-specific elongation factor